MDWGTTSFTSWRVALRSSTPNRFATSFSFTPASPRIKLTVCRVNGRRLEGFRDPHRYPATPLSKGNQSSPESDGTNPWSEKHKARARSHAVRRLQGSRPA
jgi:hypothetical protein